MAWTTPRTWATNDSLAASTLNAHLRDNLSFLYGAPRCRIYNSAVQSLTTATFTAITFDSERFDTDSMHSTVSNTSRITFTTAGIYLVGGILTFTTNGTNARAAYVRLNGATYLAGAPGPARTDGAESTGVVTTLYSFAAADYVELIAYQNSGSTLNSTVNPPQAPEFWAIWQGG